MLIDICILSGFLRTSTALFVAFVSGTTSFSEKIRLNRHCMFGESSAEDNSDSDNDDYKDESDEEEERAARHNPFSALTEDCD